MDKTSKIFEFAHKNNIPSKYVYIDDNNEPQNSFNLADNYDKFTKKIYITKMQFTYLQKHLGLDITPEGGQTLNFISEYNKWLTRYNIELKNDVIMFDKMKENQKILKNIKKPILYHDIVISNITQVFTAIFKNKNSDGLDIFNNAIVTNNIPYIQYNDKEGVSYYKVYNSVNNQSIFHELETLENDMFYITICIGDVKTKKNNIFCTFSSQKKELEIEYKKNDEAEIMSSLKQTFLNVTFKKYKETKIKGSVILDKISVFENSLYYLILTEDIFNNYLYVNESKTEESKITHLNINYKTVLENDKLTAPVRVYFQNDMIKEPASVKLNIVKAESYEILVEFLDIFCKLLGIYMEKINDVNNFFSKFIPLNLNLLNNDDDEEGIIIGKEINTSKINNLKEKMPNYYNTGTSRNVCTCDKQPLIIKDKEIKDWENYLLDNNSKRTVMKFNDNGIIHNIVCPGNEYPNVTILHKKNGTPCCGKKEYIPKENTSPEEKEVKVEKTEIKYRLIIHKILESTHVNGSIHNSLKKFLKLSYENNDFVRTYIPFSNNSLIHCVLTAIGDEKYLSYDKYDRDEYAQKIRFKIADTIHVNVYKQELYDLDDDDIDDQIKNENVFLDPYLFYRGLEEYFNVNIFVFNFNHPLHPIKYINDEKIDMPVLEIPRAKLTHIRIKREDRKTILILKHLGSPDSKIEHPHCELIISRGNILNDNDSKNYGKNAEVNTLGNTIFGKKMTVKLYNYLNNNLHAFSYEEDILRDSPFNIINWHDLFSSYGTIISQQINTFGKTVSLRLKKNNNFIDIDVLSTQPLNIKSSTVEKDIIYNTQAFDFGKSSEITEEGVWYPILDYKKGIFVRNNISTNNISLEITKLRTQKENTYLFMQLINWLWKLTVKKGKLMNINKFWNKYVILDNTVRSNVSPKYFRILPEVTDTKDALNKISIFWPEYFREDGIHLYDKLEEHAYFFFKREYVLISGLPLDDYYMQIPLHAETLYNNFKKNINNLIFTSKVNFRNWSNQRDKSNINVILDKLDIDMSYQKEPIIYKDVNDKIYLIQNVNVGNAKLKTLFLCDKWKRENINSGFYVNIESNFSLDNLSYIIYNLSNTGNILPVEANFPEGKENDENILQILNWNGNYSALLPIL